MNAKPSSKALLENPTAERALIGAFIRDTTIFWAHKDSASPALFAVERNQVIAKALHFLAENGRTLSLAAVVGGVGFASDWNVEAYIGACLADAAHADEVPDLLGDLQAMQARREMMRFAEALIKEATDGPDPMAGIETAKEKVTRIGDIFRDEVRHISEIANDITTRVSDAYKVGHVSGLPVGLKQVQDLIGPLLPGRLYLVCGSPGSGKSALMAQMAEYIAQTHPVLIHQIEMPGEEQIERILAPRAQLEADRIERAALDAEEINRLLDAADSVRNLKLWVDSSTSPTVAQIGSRAMRLQRQSGLAAMFLDHLLYVRAPDRRMADHEAVRANLQALKRLSKDMGIPIVVLTQPKAELASGPVRRPRVADMYGGAANEHEADVILLLFREEYMLRRNEPNTGEGSKEHVEWRSRLIDVEGKAEVILGKRRGGRGFGIRTLWFNDELMRFFDNVPPSARLAAQPMLYDVA